MTKMFARFMNDESGATAIEYGLIASLIGVAIIAGVRALGTQLSGTFAKVSGNLA
jgi:pilus assembly protein Flp/PilA